MNGHYFSTKDLSPRDQFAAWCSWFDPLFDVAAPPHGAGAGFVAEAEVWSLGPVTLSRVCTPRIHAVRRQRNLRRDPVDHWNIIVGQAETRLTHAGETRIIPAGIPFVVSLGETIESEREADDRLQLYLPRDHFAGLAPILDRVLGVPLLGPQGRLLADYMMLLRRAIPDLAPADLTRLPPAIHGMVQACLTNTAAHLEGATAQADLTRLEQIRLAIRRHMHRATLNPSLLCREVGISRSNLYRLLESEGGVVRHIQRMRLRAAHTAICDPADARSIMRIAEATGFFDPSAFSRAFRREFGISPSDLRQASRAGAAPLAGVATGLPAQARTLSGYLRGL